MSEAVELDEARRKYEFKKMLERLEAKEGSGTELISLYIPPDKQIYDVTAHSGMSLGSVQTSNPSRQRPMSRVPYPVFFQG